RQICAGLAAAHERGVLHRDLKPSNVMIDGRGRARLTDFGLAITTGEPSGGVIAGTPAYMAPEQRAGEPVTVRSDLYALGLVLFELFTGRPAFRGQAEGARAHVAAPSSFVSDLHGSIDRTVLGCLETEPALRPPSALAVAASLPGGDPLAALVAAGETPPPEMVAAAGEKTRVSSRFALAALALVLIGMPLAVHAMGPLFLLDAVPLEKPPEVLADRASELAIRLGALARPAWRGYGFQYADGIKTADAGETPGRSPIVFWYRQGTRPLDPINPLGTVSLLDPPPTEPGMVTVIVDTRGRLVSLRSVATPAPSGSKPSWDDVLSAAGLDPARMRSVPPSRLPPVAADERRAWEGTHGDPPVPVHVEGATLAGVPAWVEVGSGALDAPAARPGLFGSVFALAYFVALAGGLLLARRNIRLGRGDRRGAGRLAATVFLLRLAAWVLQATHTIFLPREQDLLIYALARALYGAALVWVLYVAIEPTVRRHRPGVLISWSRVLSGRLWDPLVGRDLLAGSAAAITMVLLVLIGRRGGEWLGGPLRPLLTADLDFLLGARRLLGWVLLSFSIALMGTLFIAVAFVGFRLLLRRTSAAVVACVVLLVAMWAPRTGWSRPEDLPVALAVSGVVIFVLLRFGFLATVVTAFLVSGGRPLIPFTMDLGAWYGQATLVWFVLTYGLAIFGFVTLQQGRADLPAPHED
ncbi:MAG TPA: serine/threonine-protein kinase, partial [Vicinamibacteria bacterium]|nr:serine/threonine-protein kinase [Vicinamibacteria bacterium]